MSRPGGFQVGELRVTRFHVADVSLSLGEVFGEGPEVAGYFDRPLSAKELLPVYSFLISGGETSVVVDPGEATRLNAPGHFEAPPGYRPPPALREQMTAAGFRPDQVGRVVVTHLHFDHFDGVTLPASSGPALAFPRADVLVPRLDWEMQDIAESRSKGDRDVLDTLGVVERAGLLRLLDGERELAPGVTLEPFPGESPGHQIAAVRSGGEACYLVGDLYHIKEEVEHPELAATWTDRGPLVSSRNRFAARASEEAALVLPGHMEPGRIRIDGGAASWSPA